MNNQKKDIDIFGNAIKNYFHEGDRQDIIVHSPDFDDDVIPVHYLFREYREMPPLEQKALEECSGKVLDVGCGAGSHALYLQNKKQLEVTGIDSSEGAIEICRLRGLKDARKMLFEDFEEAGFDTILLLMNGTGIVGQMKNLDGFFRKLKELLSPGGQVLIDSSDLSYLFDPDQDGGIWVNPSEGYYGELTYSLSYKDQTSSEFNWLYMDFNSLHLAASRNGFRCKLLQEGEHYNYLAKLELDQ